ncbi:MAG TPA: oligopeptide/dipeptide ABC transporter ATP-binding protein [Clostridia bacterium]|nr:oligopeptide/dipeptide ABC transporter ATP-binding protein [Clostridia bacterium]
MKKLEKDSVLLELKNLEKTFRQRKGGGKTKALSGLSLKIMKGETFGLVGESGCGKTTAARTIIGIHKPTGGEIWFDGKEIGKLDEKEMKPLRKKMQMIFQDPYGALNPRMRICDSIREPLDIHNIGTDGNRRKRVEELLDIVGLSKGHALRYPHEFSGGQRQRIGIARALALKPEFIICDEPLSALDLSVQAQIVNMLEDLKRDSQLTYLFIAHDLSMVKHISDRIGVMHMGRMVEQADSDELYSNPAHPYTKALLSSMLPLDKEKYSTNVHEADECLEEGICLKACGFRKKCPLAKKICSEEFPKMKKIGERHYCACHALD